VLVSGSGTLQPPAVTSPSTPLTAATGGLILYATAAASASQCGRVTVGAGGEVRVGGYNKTTRRGVTVNVQRLDLVGGAVTVNRNGTLMVAYNGTGAGAVFHVVGGALQGPGRLQVVAGATLSLDPPSPHANATVSETSVVNAGTVAAQRHTVNFIRGASVTNTATGTVYFNSSQRWRQDELTAMFVPAPFMLDLHTLTDGLVYTSNKNFVAAVTAMQVRPYISPYTSPYLGL
jgi:hypothetical protein